MTSNSRREKEFPANTVSPRFADLGMRTFCLGNVRNRDPCVYMVILSLQLFTGKGIVRSSKSSLFFKTWAPATGNATDIKAKLLLYHEGKTSSEEWR